MSNRDFATGPEFGLTLLDVLVLVERHDGVILAQASEGVDQMGAEVRVDVLGGELGGALSVDGPVGEVADDAASGADLALYDRVLLR